MSVTLTRPTRRRANFHDLRITDVERLTDQAVAVRLAVPQQLRADFDFEPGQHLTLRAEIDGEDVRRSYSICVSRSQWQRTGEMRVATARVTGGVMSNWLNDRARVGDTVAVMTPMGSFTAATDPAARRHHVAVAAGSGITPVLSLVTTALEEEPASRATLIFGNRRTDSIMFLEELMDCKNRFPERFTLLNVLSREPQDAELLSGRIDRDRLERFLATLVPVDDVDEWYLCGPFGMVETAREVLSAHGVDEHTVRHEVFHVDEASPSPTTAGREAEEEAAAAAVVTLTLDGRTTQVPMRSRAESILAATLRERPDAPFSCTGGVCGTCRARLVDGEVTMDRNYALEPEEIEAGIVLACQSHPVTDTVTLDYDA
ncbi:MAG: 1,2-phenylacetyl-CoA epoxidase subunit PaaE [Ornithinimicrobium sp.]|uniref:1,2-phenylacetyl-CoA epoxidase subunit PaaE n=1 Tax=Ornithinimicrobium sp. TaxID=1977084 RepID=UPI003D9B7C12